MFSRIHARLGTAGFVVAILAVIVALAGTAFAAAGLNSKQKNEVKKIAQKYAGKTGAPGAAGAQGPKGDSGARGAIGPEGPPGQDGQDGLDGEAGVCSVTIPECKLPPGATLTGDWSFGVPAGGWSEVGDGESGPRTLVSISFGLAAVPPGGEPQTRWVGQDAWLEPSEEYDRANCPGSVSNPEAEPGFLCFYTEEMFNAGQGPRRRFCSDQTRNAIGGRTLAFCLKDPSEEAWGTGSWALTAEE